MPLMPEVPLWYVVQVVLIVAVASAGDGFWFACKWLAR
jgi:hypothetical protein